MLLLAADENLNNKLVRGVQRLVATMARFAYDRVEAGLSMPGVFEIGIGLPLAVAIEEIVLLAECSINGEWEGQVRYLPLR